ncbi:MAG: TfoX/Sxy family protein [Prolixibacteraceae bacterium]|jgi:TfoX/Sxy family transcriptional regulator of competence genes|nr:TfoX/Sxy family protein [Prolixibacteraceae bacterium]
MAYNEFLADRVTQVLKDKRISFYSKKMMGGLTFMVDDKMCVGIIKDDLMVRLDPEIYESSILKEGCRPMDFTHRPIKGYVFVDALAVDMDSELEYWIQLALDFNPKAINRKKKKKTN